MSAPPKARPSQVRRVEEVARDYIDEQKLVRPVPMFDAYALAAARGQALKRGRPSGQVAVFGIGEQAFAVPRGHREDARDFAGARNAQRVEPEAVDETEDGGVGSNAERQRQRHRGDE